MARATFAFAVLPLSAFAIAVYRYETARGQWQVYAVAAVILGLLHVTARYFAPRARVQKHGIETSPTNRVALLVQVADLAAELAADHRPFDLLTYGDLLLSPTSIRARIGERIELRRRSSNRTVTIDLRTPFASAAVHTPPKPRPQLPDGSSSRALLVPVMVPRKGTLYDAENIVDQRGVRVSALTTSDITDVNVALIWHLFCLSYKVDADINEWDINYRYHLYDLVDIAVRTKKHAKTLTEARKILANFAQRYDHEPKYQEKLTRIVLTLCRRYVIAAILDTSTTTSLGYLQRIPTTNISLGLRQNTLTKRVVARARFLERFLNIPSGYVRVPIRIGAHCQSYHLHVSAPDGSYMRMPSLRLRGESLSFKADVPQLAISTPYLRASLESATECHIYGRGLRDLFGDDATTEVDEESDQDDEQRTAVQFRIYESPWGSQLLGVLIWAGLLIAAILLQGSYKSGHDSDILAALIALPVALVTVGVIYQQTAAKSFTTSFAGLITGFMGFWVGVALVAAFGFTQALRPEQTDPDQWRVGVIFWHWAIALVATFAIGTFAAFVLRVARFWIPVE